MALEGRQSGPATADRAAADCLDVFRPDTATAIRSASPGVRSSYLDAMATAHGVRSRVLPRWACPIRVPFEPRGPTEYRCRRVHRREDRAPCARAVLGVRCSLPSPRIRTTMRRPG